MAPALKATWKEITQRNGAPKARSSHALAVIEKNVFIFGGEFEPRVPIDNLIYKFDLEKLEWSTVDAGGDIPSPRIGVAMASLGKTLYVFAGRDEKHEELSEFFSFDTETSLWKKLPAGPPHRSYHTFVSDPSRLSLYTFGGCGKDGRLNDLWVFHVDSGSWECLSSPSLSPSPSLLPRGGPGLSVVGNGVYVLFGFNGKELNDVYRFDLDSRAWEIIYDENISQNLSVKPIPRSVFVASSFNNSVVLYGGEVDPSDLGHMGAGHFSDEVWVLDTEERVWVKPEVRVEGEGERGPGGRGWYSAAKVGENQMIVYGGNSETNDRLDDMFLLTVEM